MKVDPKTRRRAKELRRELTDAERILWSRIKGRQLGGWMFRVQHPVEPYILDFACVKLKLAVELDGATHSTLDERRHDERRTRYLAESGWVVMRFWNDEVYRNLHGVVETIMGALPPKAARARAARARRATHAGPPPSGA
jgi:very-short-patch-repair endonuclease